MWRYTLPLGSLTFLFNAIFQFFPLPFPTILGQVLGDLSLAALLLSLYYYRSKNRRLFASRTLTYTLMLGITVSIFGLTVLLITRAIVPLLPTNLSSALIANITSALIIGFAFEPLRLYLTRQIERWFFKEEKANEKLIESLTDQLNSAATLDQSVDHIVHSLVENLHLQFAVTYVFQTTEESHLAIKRVRQLGFKDSHQLALSEQDTLFTFITKTSKSFSATELEREILKERRQIETNKLTQDSTERSAFLQNHALKVASLRKLKHLNVSYILPLSLNSQLLGLIFLSPKRNRAALTPSDLTVLQTISHLSIGAIQKASLYEGEQLKGEFISIASHELRTPLTAIKGYISMMLDEKIAGMELDSESKQYLHQVQHTTKQLAALVNDMLAISRLESGKMTVTAQQLDSVSAIQKLIAQAQPTALSRNIIIFTPGLGDANLPSAWIDPEVFNQIFANLIMNAITYNKESGQIEIRVNYQPQSSSLQITISDTGIGMTKEQVSHLFERFYRVQSEDTQGLIGTGLGLYLVKNLLERSGGAITVQSTPQKGSSFMVTLPIFTVDSSTSQPSGSESSSQTSKEPIGLILLPPKLNGDGYSQSDVRFLEALGKEAITAIEKAKLYENDRSKSEFVSVATHELLTPISAIEGYLSMILEHPEKLKRAKPQTIEYLNNIYSSAKRLSTLIRDLLSVARIESGKISFEPKDLNLEPLIQSCIAQMEFIAQEKSIGLSFTPPLKQIPTVYADSDRTTQILINLISNAIKYNNEHGKVIVSLRYEPINHRVWIEVADNGLGMNHSEMEHLFEKFYRIDSPERTGIIGTGLGLYITKSILERMGGTIEVKSSPGKGSSFRFSLPLGKDML